ncbi:hypothetical protein ASPVEDRAFT_69808 [Aspergillus versicolor CBS 583.65]|uniref:Uncharacterized protein n=1 Tax=Aspergillus versicolor CBS 583.65 TaxID=1036611 RepID=A0A1L9PCX3_ASPVE|nr:uncharacterized protein ASPVEDRAFT_69808 [Aspergillus versicolor CBS 583.65]OJI99387.1 hypothetical protein ASPVEDRAFT_69808 [Aspergillus versicolor CBS 583.65]
MQSSKTPANKSEPVSGLMKKYKRTKMEKNKGQEELRRVKRRLRGDKTRTRPGQEEDKKEESLGSRETGRQVRKITKRGPRPRSSARPSQRGAWRLGQDFSLANEKGGGSTIAYFSGAWDGEERRGSEGQDRRRLAALSLGRNHAAWLGRSSLCRKSPPSEHPGRAQSKLSDVSPRPMQHTMFMAIQIIMQSPRAVPGS